MPKFIEVHSAYPIDKSSGEVMVNLANVKDIQKDKDGNAVIFFSFQNGEKNMQDYFCTEETYEEVREMVAIKTGGVKRSSYANK